MATPLTPRNKRALQRAATQNVLGGASTKSVVFLLEPPEPKPKIKSLKETTKESVLNRFSVFDKQNSCRMMFEIAGSKGKLRSKRNKSMERKQSIETDFLNISDGFQYKTQPLLEEDDLILNITSKKTMMKNMGELEQKRHHKSKKSNIMIIKTNPRMRRRSDTSTWSGGESELERKIVFLTFEYIAKPISLQTGVNTLKGSQMFAETPNKDTPSRGTPSLKSMSSFKLDGSPKCVSAGKKGLGHSRLSQSKAMLLGNQERNSPGQLGSGMRESEVLREKFVLNTEDNKDNVKGGVKKDEEVLQKYLMIAKERLDTQKSNEISDGELSRENSPAHRKNKLSGELERRKAGTSLTFLKERSRKPTPPKKDPFNIQLKYFQPIRSVRTNVSSVKANSAIKEHITFAETAGISVRQIPRRDLSTGSVRMKDTPTSGKEDCYEFGPRVKLLQEMNKDTIEIKNLANQTTRSTQSGALFKIHKTLVKKIHGHGRSTSSLIGGAPSGVEDETQKSAPKTSRQDKTNFTVIGKTQDQKRPLLRVDSNHDVMIMRPKKNSQERTPGKTSFETSRKTKVADFKTLISAEEIQSNFMKTLRSEGLFMKNKKVGKFKPAVSDTKQVLKSYGIGK